MLCFFNYNYIHFILTIFQGFEWSNNRFRNRNEFEFFKLIGFNRVREIREDDSEKCFAIEISKKNFTYRKQLIANGCNNGAFNYICKFGKYFIF